MKCPPKPLIIATRDSPLALWQARDVQRRLKQAGYQADILPLKTSGDKLKEKKLSQIDLKNIDAIYQTGKGLFIKEIQEALLEGTADIAVHSLKDLPVEPTPKIRMSCMLPRSSPQDALVLSQPLAQELGFKNQAEALHADFHACSSLLQKSQILLSKGVGTSSARRTYLIKKYLGEKVPVNFLRGNINTRLSKLEKEEHGALILARAGLQRLELEEKYFVIPLPTDTFIPAAAQGVIALEICEGKEDLHQILQELNCGMTWSCATQERKKLQELGGSCHSAMGIYCDNDDLIFFVGGESSHKNQF